MGCFISRAKFQVLSSDIGVSEEEFIHSSENTLYSSFFVPIFSSVRISSSSPLDSVSEMRDSIPFPILSGMGYSPLKLVLAFNLISDNSPDENAKNILELFNRQSFSSEEVLSLIDSLIEISSRTLPFLVYNLKHLNEWDFYYYMSSLAKSKRSYRKKCKIALLGNADNIDKCLLAKRLAASSLVYSHLVREELWNMHVSESELLIGYSSLISAPTSGKRTTMEVV